MRRKDREVTDIEKIKEILDACKVSRIGLMDQGKVYIVPMNHATAWRMAGWYCITMEP